MEDLTRAQMPFPALVVVLLIAGATGLVAADTDGAAGQQAGHAAAEAGPSTMKIRLRVGERSISATLLDSETSRDLFSLLPLKLTLEDYAATEKISYLPRKLSTPGAMGGVDPAVGDIACYAPWGNLAIFYRDFGYSNGLVRMGTIDGSGIEALEGPGPVQVTIERIEDVPGAPRNP